MTLLFAALAVLAAVFGWLASLSLITALAGRLARRWPARPAPACRDRRKPTADGRTAGRISAAPIIAFASHPCPPPSSRVGGFTLIEMLCTVTVAGLLSSVAYPTYQGAVTKTRRADALAATLAIQAAQERYRSGSVAYGSLSDIGASARSPAGHYLLSVLAASETGYTLLAAANGSQSADSGCRYLKMTADGANLSYSSGASEAVVNDDASNRRCWNL